MNVAPNDPTNPYAAPDATAGPSDVYRHSESNFGTDQFPSHPALFGYIAWLFGIFGAHRFYFGKPISGVLYAFTLGLFFIGWIFDFFAIPAMAEEAKSRYRTGHLDYTIAWGLLTFLGIFGIHRFYLGKLFTGLIYLLTGGLLGFGVIYDFLTLNEQVDEANQSFTSWPRER